MSCKLCRDLRQGIHTGNGRRIGKYWKPLHVEDAVTIYNRLGKAIEAQMTGSDGSES